MAECPQQPRQAALAASLRLLCLFWSTLLVSPALLGACLLIVSLFPSRPCLCSSTILSVRLLRCIACCAARPCSICMQAYMLWSAAGRLSRYRVACARLLSLPHSSDALDCWHLQCGLHKEDTGRARRLGLMGSCATGGPAMARGAHLAASRLRLGAFHRRVRRGQRLGSAGRLRAAVRQRIGLRLRCRLRPGLSRLGLETAIIAGGHRGLVGHCHCG